MDFSDDTCISIVGQSLLGSLPVDNIPDGTEILGFSVLVLKIVLGLC